jgi:6-phosphogluconolactonase
VTAAIKIFPEPGKLAEAIALELKKEIKQANDAGRRFNLVLAGGGTPRAVYGVLARPEFKTSIQWGCVHFFWGDERSVPPDHADSNFKMAKETLLAPLDIPKENIHRMRGENNPTAEAMRYANEIKNNLNERQGETPRFDWILLGLGTDGHTGSLFPGVDAIEDHSGLCAVSVQPESGQQRITLTNRVLNQAHRVSFIVTGKSKAQVVAEILNDSPKSKNYPAAQLHPESGILEWFLDEESATDIK